MWENETSRWQGWPRDYSLPSSLVSVPCFNFILMDLYLTKDVFTHHLFFQTNLIRPWRGLLSKYKQQFLFKFPINCLISLFDHLASYWILLGGWFSWNFTRVLHIAACTRVGLYWNWLPLAFTIQAKPWWRCSEEAIDINSSNVWYCLGFIFLSIKWCK